MDCSNFVINDKMNGGGVCNNFIIKPLKNVILNVKLKTLCICKKFINNNLMKVMVKWTSHQEEVCVGCGTRGMGGGGGGIGVFSYIMRSVLGMAYSREGYFVNPVMEH